MYNPNAINYLHDYQIDIVLKNKSKYKGIFITNTLNSWFVIDTRTKKMIIKEYKSINDAIIFVRHRREVNIDDNDFNWNFC